MTWINREKLVKEIFGNLVDRVTLVYHRGKRHICVTKFMDGGVPLSCSVPFWGCKSNEHVRARVEGVKAVFEDAVKTPPAWLYEASQ